MRASLAEGVQDQRLHRAFRAARNGYRPDRGSGRRSRAPRRHPDSLAARVLQAEHRLYPHALGLVASGAVRVEGERVVGMTRPTAKPPIFRRRSTKHFD